MTGSNGAMSPGLHGFPGQGILPHRVGIHAGKSLRKIKTRVAGGSDPGWGLLLRGAGGNSRNY